MLDVIIKGCVIAGMVVGTGMEYFSYNVNPTYARERFHEAHDLIVKAWAAEGPFVWEGTHYRFRYINLWPQPSQKPHPPIWIPGSGSPETMEWVAHQRYTYMVLPSCGHLPHAEQRRWPPRYWISWSKSALTPLSRLAGECSRLGEAALTSSGRIGMLALPDAAPGHALTDTILLDRGCCQPAATYGGRSHGLSCFCRYRQSTCRSTVRLSRGRS